MLGCDAQYCLEHKNAAEILSFLKRWLIYYLITVGADKNSSLLVQPKSDD